MLGYATSRIEALMIGGCDHTTVLHACRKIAELKESDADIREDYKNLLRTLTT